VGYHGLFARIALTFFLNINIWQEQGMESQLWNMALLAGPREQLEAAQHFEASDKALQDKAVILYHRAGMLHKALDLAFKYVYAVSECLKLTN
jgi:intraflagellar transport protein 140